MLEKGQKPAQTNANQWNNEKKGKTSGNTVEKHFAGASPDPRRRQPNSPESDRRRRRYQNQRPQTQSPTTRQRFNINSAAVQTNQLLRQPLTSLPAATFGTKHHRPGRPNNTTDHHQPSITICGHEAHCPDCRRTK
jgi:hypothetical protein